MTKMCFHPWVGLDVSPQGEFKPCCKYSHSIASSLKKYYDSYELVQLRQDFLDGKLPTGCKRCWRDEESGIVSKRQLDFQYHFHNEPPNLDSLKIISIPFGNTCNLACRICSSYSSSRWNTESTKIKHILPEIKIFPPANFYRNTEFMQEIKNALSEVTHIDIPGGEPFYADKDIHLDFLNSIKNPNNVKLHYTTNVTKMPATDVKQVWTKFKQVDIQLSIDGIQKTFEYNRWPAKWSDVLQNINMYIQEVKKNKNLQISLSHSVSIFTVYYLPEFLIWCKKYNLPEPWLGLVSHPSYYDITVLPTEAKQTINKKFDKFSMPQLESIKRAMWAKDNSNELDKFIKHVKILDIQRNQNFPDVFNELYDLLGKRCQILYHQY
jgi:MoaA/NifB/PqqE/SkfB family radical SAM enzyme